MLAIRLAALILVAMLAACAGRATTDFLPDGAVLPDSAQVPSSTTLAVYLPSNQRKGRLFVRGFWLLPGKAMEEGVGAVSEHFFKTSFLAEADSDKRFGLLLAIQPEWKVESGDLRMTMRYRVFSKDAAPLLEGERSYSTSLGDLRNSDSFYNAALRTMQLVEVDVIARLAPTAEKYPIGWRVRDIDAARYVNHDKPTVSGTGFFINGSGQVMTAAHVLHDCALTEVRRDDKVMKTKPIASSALLDLAVVNTDVPATASLPLRRGEALMLGEPVVNVGFPLQPLLSRQPSLTRGNISSYGALAGSLGQFQFSAPIQPGSSGGPVVSDGGELLGITQSTLNPTPLIEKGVLPQNVNFALEARYAAAFMRKNNIAFNEVPTNFKGDMQSGNNAALASVVSVACYQ